MKLFRFFEDKTGYVTKSKYDSGVYLVNKYEGYAVDNASTGMFVKSRLFGYRKPKKEHVITVRVCDGTPLYPLENDYLSPSPIMFSDLKTMDNASFIKAQFDAEKDGVSPSEKIGMYLTYGALSFAFIFTLLLIPKIIPYFQNTVLESFGG